MGESEDEGAEGGGAEKKVKRESEDVGLAQKERPTSSLYIYVY